MKEDYTGMFAGICGLICILLAAVLLFGCTTEVIREVPIEVIKEVPVEVIKYINITSDCKVCQEQINCSKTDKIDYTNNLTACHSQMDLLDSELHLCLVRNTSVYRDDLYENYTKCDREREDYLNIVNNITEALK